MSTEQAKSEIVELAQTVIQGDIPTTEQVTAAITKTTDVVKEGVTQVDLDPATQKLVDDTQTLLEDTKRMLEEKRTLDHVGQLMKDSKEAIEEVKQKVPDWNEIEQKAKEEAYSGLGQEATEVINVGKRLTLKLVKSKDFRWLLIDFIDLVQALLQKAVASVPSVAETLKTDIKKQDASLEETKDSVKEFAENVKKTATTVQEKGVRKILPAEYVKRVNKQFQLIITKLSNNKDYQELVNGVFSILDHFKSRARKLTETTFDPAESEAFQRVWKDVKDIIESFVGIGSLDTFGKKLGYLLNEFWQDKDAAVFFSDLREFTVRAMQDPKWTTTDDFTEAASELMERAQEIVQSEKYEHRIQVLLSEGRYLLSRFAEDPYASKLAEDGTKIAEDLLMESGKLSFWKLQKNLSQIRTLVVPIILKQLESIPLPRLQGSTPKLDYWLENVIFGTKELVPEKIYLKFDDLVEVSTRQMALNRTVGYLLLQISDINVELRDIRFWFRKKTFPALEDSGIMDVFIAGEDTKIVVRWKLESEGDGPFVFTVDAVDCFIDKMKINFKQAHHDWLLKLAAKLFMNQVKRAIEEYVETSLMAVTTLISEKLYLLAQQDIVSASTQVLSQGISQGKEILNKGKEIVSESASELAKALPHA